MRTPSPLGFLATVLAASMCFAQSGPDLMIRPFPKDNILEMRGEAFGLRSAEVEQTGDDFRLGIYELEGRYRLAPGKRYDPRIGFDVTHLDIGGDFAGVPSHLTDTAVAVGLGVLDKNGWLGGASIGVGYAGDDPFSDANAWYGKFDLAFGKTLSENAEIGIVIDYDGNRSVYRDLPLPGFAYRLRLYDQRLLMALGFPYTSVEWRPNEHWTLELRWSIPDNVELFANYKIAEGLGVFASLRRRVDSFHWDDLPNANDRLFFEQKRAEVGFTYEPIERLRAELAIGYAFSQEFSTGWNASETDLVGDISDEPYLRVGVQWQY
jgi:hypothetical protein